MISPPRTVELLLASLGAEPRFRDAVIGDLAEEFAFRAEREGEASATRWYYREAARATPHLALSWLRGLGLAGAKRVAGVVSVTSAITLVAFNLTMAAVASALAAVTGVYIGTRPAVVAGVPIGAEYSPALLADRSYVAYIATSGIPVLTGRGLIVVALLLVAAAVGLFGGYLAASLDRRSPLATSATLASAWAAVALVDAGVRGGPTSFLGASVWFNLAPILVMLVGVATGGALRATKQASAHDPDETIGVDA